MKRIPRLARGFTMVELMIVVSLIAILSVFTLAGLFLWGRAVFCGWLCPFGALQELVSMAARRFRVRQISIPIALHERLIAVKYLLFLSLVAASFFSWDLAMRGAEVEPFKAAIILRFMTEWPMVVYALTLTETIGAGIHDVRKSLSTFDAACRHRPHQIHFAASAASRSSSFKIIGQG